jgi:hypothetical protein
MDNPTEDLVSQPTAGNWEVIEITPIMMNFLAVTSSKFVIRASGAPGGLALTIGGLGEEERANAKLIATAGTYRGKIDTALHAAKDALRSYQFGNDAPDLAQRCADHIEGLINEMARFYGQI